jgi:hypothetical protein
MYKVAYSGTGVETGRPLWRLVRQWMLVVRLRCHQLFESVVMDVDMSIINLVSVAICYELEYMGKGP